MKNFNKIFLLLIFVAFTAFSFAQTSITGTVTDKDDGTALPGVTIVAKGTTIGTISDLDGKYKIDVPAGTQFLVFSYLGMDTQEFEISGATTIDVQMTSVSEELVEIFVIADRAKERETPVAFSDVTKEEIQQQLGSRDIPLVMNMTPSVYSTESGGGAGDARINVRGFNQRNVAIMINGVPVNDMENGWVYWSNWDGVGDATSSIQMQRGLSAVNLATPSIGGTMNIITSPADKKRGGSAQLEYGSGNFMKMTLSGHSGMINDQFAISASVVGKQGAGIIDQTWTKAAAYYLGAHFKANDNHKFELFAMGAPQRHGQNLYKQNISAYGSDIAADFGSDPYTIEEFPESNADESYPDFSDAKGGRYYNENWGPVSSTYTGKQWWNGKEHDRYSPDHMSERENFFHKPLANINWYAKWTDRLSQYTTVYYSGGKGGGTGTYGSMRWQYNAGLPSPSRFVSWDETVIRNTDDTYAWSYDILDAAGNEIGTGTQPIGATQSLGILRNSVNNQWTVGAISRVKILINDRLKAQVGVDWRTAEIDHFREVRDLVGGTYFSTRDANGNRLIEEIVDGRISYEYNESDFWTTDDHQMGLGHGIDYNFTNTVDWMGYFAQAEYTTQKITAYASFGNSYIKYTYKNFFVYDADESGYLKAETKYLPGYQIKGGLSFRPIGGFSVFGNYGYISKAPIFDNIISDRDGTVADDVQNEIFNAFEFGVNYQTPKRNVDLKVNYYNTNWTNRALNIGVINQDGSEGFIFVSGMDQVHSGFEFEGYYKPIKYLEIGAMASVGNWTYTNNVSGTYKDYSSGSEQDLTYDYYTEGLKVGDAPQTQFGGMLTIIPINGLRLQFDARNYSKHYADWDPFSRTDETDTEQVWETPSYFLADVHLSYKLPLKGTFGVEVFGHVFNLLDEIYVQDATDNSRYNGNYSNEDGSVDFNHDINTAELFLGLPRRFNAGVRITF